MTNVEIGGALTIVALLCAVVALVGATAPTRIARPHPLSPQATPPHKENDMPESTSPAAAPKAPAKKQSSRAASRLASKILRDKSFRPCVAEIRMLAASVLSQDETKGPAPVAKRARKKPA